MREIFDWLVIIIGAMLFLCGLALLFMHPWLLITFLVIVLLAFVILFGLKWIKGWFVDVNLGAKERRVKQMWSLGLRRVSGLRAEDEDLRDSGRVG